MTHPSRRRKAPAGGGGCARKPGGLEPTLEEVVKILEQANKKVRKYPDFENGCDACLATRVAWSFLYSDWQRAGACAPAMVRRLRRALADSQDAVKIAAGSARKRDDRIALLKYTESIALRRRLLELLPKAGPEAVLRAAASWLRERKPQSQSQSRRRARKPRSGKV